MTWFKDNNGHITESKNKMHRLLYCPLCRKLISKGECQRLRQDKDGKLYEVKRYCYNKFSKIQRAERKTKREEKRQLGLSTVELSKIIKHIF
jgi:hypothetical protein